MTDRAVAKLRARWAAGERVAIESLVAGPKADPDGVLDLIYAEVLLREQAGERPHAAEYVARFPALAGPIRTQFEVHEAIRADTATPEIPGYRLVRELGRGGLGEVHEAVEERTGERVAVKLLRAELAADGGARRRFEIEARVGVVVGHPGIVPVRTVGEWAGGPYLVLRLMEGGSLADRLQRGAIPIPEAVQVVIAASGAVHAAHAAGVIHRDLKPANMLFDAAGRSYVADFGMAKLAAPGVAEGFTPTASGAVIGTPAFMAPEQAAGAAPAVAQDVYALGALLYAALTGRPPHDEGSYLATLLRLRAGGPAPRPRRLRRDVPPGLDDVCARALSADPDARHPSAAALADTLSAWSGTA